MGRARGGLVGEVEAMVSEAQKGLSLAELREMMRRMADGKGA